MGQDKHKGGAEEDIAEGCGAGAGGQPEKDGKEVGTGLPGFQSGKLEPGLEIARNRRGQSAQVFPHARVSSRVLRWNRRLNPY